MELDNRARRLREQGVLLLMPRDLYRAWPVGNYFSKHLLAIPSCSYPQLAAMIPQVPVTHFDGLFEQRMTQSEYIDLLKKPAVIGISVVSPLAAFNTELTIRLIRHHNPDAVVVLGGHHATFFAEQWLQRGADVVVRREGERTFQRLIEHIRSGEDWRDLDGISTCDGESFHHNPDAPFVENLDELPLPNWNIMNLSLYHMRLIPGGPPASIETSRGCPNQCAFCVASAMWQGRQRFRSADNILTQLEMLHRLGVEQIFFSDDNFGQNVERDTQVFEEILRRGWRFGIMALVRADLAQNQPALVQLAARAGLKMVLIGYESVEQEVLNQYRKKLTGLKPNDFPRVYEIYRRNGVFVYGLFILDSYVPTAKSSPWAEYRGFKTISDFASLQSFVPMQGIPALEEMRAWGYQVYDTFYRDRFTAGFRRGGVGQSLSFAALNLFDLLRPASVLKVWNRDFTSRMFYRSLYRGLAHDVRRLTPLGIRAFLSSFVRRSRPEEGRQKLLRMALKVHDLD